MVVDLAKQILICGVLSVWVAANVMADDTAAVQAIVKRTCAECHSGDRLEAEIDLASFGTEADLHKRPRVWQKVGEMLESGQMPPPEAKQPTDAEKALLRGWVKSHLLEEAKAHAGDPGRVVLRRLSHAEYTYTIRDLTGVVSLDPASQFPQDGAAGEGFTNAGAALVMSPALVTKYLDAAKEIAQHAVLLPEGFRFSPLTTRRDLTNDTLDRIRAFYAQFTNNSGSDKVNLQGIVFDTNQGGRLPIEQYLQATLAHREALLAGKTTIAEVARDRKSVV